MSTSEYSTSDLYLAAYFKAAGVPMVRVDRLSDSRKGARLAFVFNTDKHNMDQLNQNWWTNNDMVSARVYAGELRALKSVCHNGL